MDLLGASTDAFGSDAVSGCEGGAGGCCAASAGAAVGCRTSVATGVGTGTGATAVVLPSTASILRAKSAQWRKQEAVRVYAGWFSASRNADLPKLEQCWWVIDRLKTGGGVALHTRAGM